MGPVLEHAGGVDGDAPVKRCEADVCGVGQQHCRWDGRSKYSPPQSGSRQGWWVDATAWVMRRIQLQLLALLYHSRPRRPTNLAVRVEPCSLCVITRFGGAAIPAFKGVVLGSPPSTCMSVFFFVAKQMKKGRDGLG